MRYSYWFSRPNALLNLKFVVIWQPLSHLHYLIHLRDGSDEDNVKGSGHVEAMYDGNVRNNNSSRDAPHPNQFPLSGINNTDFGLVK